jgi:hypothetical protein
VVGAIGGVISGGLGVKHTGSVSGGGGWGVKNTGSVGGGGWGGHRGGGWGGHHGGGGWHRGNNKKDPCAGKRWGTKTFVTGSVFTFTAKPVVAAPAVVINPKPVVAPVIF